MSGRGDGTVAAGWDQATFAAFVDEHILGHADAWDREQHLPETIVRRLGSEGFLVPSLPVEAGGLGLDWLGVGALNEEVGRGCASVRNLLGVQGMVAHAILRWGRSELVDRWVARLGTGEAVGAFALTEAAAGSDARAAATVAERSGRGFVLTGVKRWISFAQRADVFLVVARLDDDLAVFVVERATDGLTVAPIGDLLGLRASDLAEVRFDRCEVDGASLLSHGRLTFAAVVTSALDLGRYSTAWGGVGLGQACLSASLDYSAGRSQFGQAIADHQLVRRMLTDLVVSVEAARGLCRRAGELRDRRDPRSVGATLTAKYFASTMAYKGAGDAVQIHGANGIGADFPVQRLLRDAKVQEIVEGTTQVHQTQIAELALRERSRARTGPGSAGAGG